MEKNTYSIVVDEFNQYKSYHIKDNDTGVVLTLYVERYGKIKVENIDNDGYPTTEAFKNAQENLNKIEKEKKYYDKKYLLKTLRDIDINVDWDKMTNELSENERKMYDYVLNKFNIKYPIIDICNLGTVRLVDMFMDYNYHIVKLTSGKEILMRKKGVPHKLKLVTDHFTYDVFTGRFILKYNHIDPVLFNIAVNKTFNRNTIDPEDIDKCTFIIPEDKEIIKEIHRENRYKEVCENKTKYIESKGKIYTKN